MRSARLLIAAPLVCAACTFTGLGNYDIATCQNPAGSSAKVVGVGTLGPNPDFTFTSASGAGAIGAFVAVSSTSGGQCVQGVVTSGYIGTDCSFFGTTMNGGTLGATLSPRQPWAVPMGGGDAVTAVATTAPCTQGQVWFEYDAQGVAAPGSEPSCNAAGASLPSVVAIDTRTALMAWYQTSFSTREDPIQSCSSAKAAPLVVSTVTVNSTAATVTMPVQLSMQSAGAAGGVLARRRSWTRAWDFGPRRTSVRTCSSPRSPSRRCHRSCLRLVDV